MKARNSGLLLAALVAACRMSVDLNAPNTRAPTSPTQATVFLSNCSKTSIPGLTSIPQLGTGIYLGQQGGMYPGGSNTIPPAHLALGLNSSSQVQPRDANGNVDPANGKIVEISFGGSTAVRVFAGDSAMINGVLQNAFKPLADVDPAKNPNLVIVNTAQANKPLKNWLDPSDSAWIVLDQRLGAAGVTPAQVQVGWFMVAEGRGAVFGFPVDDQNYRDSVEYLVRFVKSRYANMQQAFLSTHYYQGYRPASIEPGNYEQGFGLKWVIEDQITHQRNMNADPNLGPVVAPWVGWGTHLWTNGIIPNADGLYFLCSEFDSNGVHLIRAGVDKAGPRMLDFFKTDPTTTAWFVNNFGQLGDLVWDDLNGNGVQDLGEPGIGGLTVTLAGSGVTRTTTTDAAGQYLFTGLPAGSFTIAVAPPPGYVSTPAHAVGSNSSNDSDGNPAAVNLATNASVDLSIDIGFTTAGAGSIGDFVWNDLNFNGVQDAGEPGLAGVTVSLSGASNGATTTAPDGSYNFSNLIAGTYTVTVTKPTGYSATLTNQGGDPLTDSNASPTTVTLATNSSASPSIDFGFVQGSVITLDIASSATSGGLLVNTLSWSHKVTAARTNRFLLVSVGLRNKTSQTVSSVKWGGTSLTRIQAISQGTAVRSELWSLVNPATGIRTITVTVSGAATSVVAGATTYDGVHQTTPLGTAVTKAIASNKVALNVTSAVREVVVDGVVKQNALEGVVPGTGQVQRWTNQTSRPTNGDNVVSAGSDKAGSTTVSLSWTASVARAWAMVAVPLKPAP